MYNRTKEKYKKREYGKKNEFRGNDRIKLYLSGAMNFFIEFGCFSPILNWLASKQ